ncbi:tRNA-Thr(GGU) m(6)t(6)A37 methyltransferase TsaA [Faunimonas pinastri]|uniref:tRNA-Thr(GGU) m(6)t(6)A37 methyltransferase TsaA n=1 Tax=Faunimonas pinastri TaxID=1855383 RepID=A0A1H9FVL8_9HYPH|nr:TrmO family methyltransferase [Faunimonas pinastri]SEQ41593.1 tRNA-Thr(GGU) m(6)t(6)A37 methyltransferase TsaA [Faunimonas pinastri]
MTEIREGEIALPFDPAERTPDASLVFIGRARTPWDGRTACPHNMTQARERGAASLLEIDPEWRRGLRDIVPGPAILLYWMHEARRDLIVQAPKKRPEPAGVFSLRSPVRPNPIALAVVEIIACDAKTGHVEIDALDCLDGTPILDLKPWIAGIDIPPSYKG